MILTEPSVAPHRPTRYTVTGFRSLKVRFLAGLELYLHLDSTNLSRASLATSSDTVGTLEDQTHTYICPSLHFWC